jgi:hypothetical protein
MIDDQGVFNLARQIADLALALCIVQIEIAIAFAGTVKLDAGHLALHVAVFGFFSAL